MAGRADSEQARCLGRNACYLGTCNLAQSVTELIVDESGFCATGRYTKASRGKMIMQGPLPGYS